MHSHSPSCPLCLGMPPTHTKDPGALEHPPLLKVYVKPFWDCQKGTSLGTENHTIPIYKNATMPYARPPVSIALTCP